MARTPARSHVSGAAVNIYRKEDYRRAVKLFKLLRREAGASFSDHYSRCVTRVLKERSFTANENDLWYPVAKKAFGMTAGRWLNSFTSKKKLVSALEAP